MSQRISEGSSEQAVYRIRRSHMSRSEQADYRYTLTLVDDTMTPSLARCDVSGGAVHSVIEITDGGDRNWKMVPDRRVMPSRWAITDPAGEKVMAIQLQILRKLANPVHRVALTLVSASNPAYRIVDNRRNVLDRVLAPNPAEWLILDDIGVVGKLTRLRSDGPKPSGPLRQLSSWWQGTDRCIVTFGADHVFAAPVALGLQIIMDEVTDPSVGP